MFLPVVLVVLGAEACQLLYTGSVPYRLAVVAIVNVGVWYSLSPYRVLNSDTASALTLLSRHIVISPLSS